MNLKSFTHHFTVKASILIAVVVLTRWAVGGFDFSYFIVAGSHSCDSTVTEIMVQPGYSYDGEYYYRYAIAPLNTDNPFHGIYVSTPAYRHQRIFYPVLTWIFSLGGKKLAIPLVMVLVNFLCFILFIQGTKKLLNNWYAASHYLMIALLLPGIWMALARDLAEVVEICLFVYIALALHHQRKFAFCLLATAMLFTRETSILVLIAIMAQQLILFVRTRERERLSWLMYSTIPIVLFLCFKLWLMWQYQTTTDIGAFNLNMIPLKGFYEGFLLQWYAALQNGLRGSMILLFSILQLFFIGWSLLLGLSQKTENKWLANIIILWLVVCPFLSLRIWETDWGFARALTIPLFCSMLLAACANALSKKYLMFAVGLLLLLLVRLVVKV